MEAHCLKVQNNPKVQLETNEQKEKSGERKRFKVFTVDDCLVFQRSVYL